MATKNEEFKEMSQITREEAKKWLEEKKVVRYLEKIFPRLEENQIFIIRGSDSGVGKTFFIRKVENQQWFSAYLSKGLCRSKEFYILEI